MVTGNNIKHAIISKMLTGLLLQDPGKQEKDIG
jgi:hypothetical protein